MRIGITYDLKDRYIRDGYLPEEVAECDCVETIDAIDDALLSLGFGTDRIGNIRDLVVRLAGGDRWDLVFNIAEGLYGLCRESQIPALLDAYRIPYVFSDSLTLAIALHKGLAKSVVHDHGVPTADHRVVRDDRELAKISLPFPLFVKPVGGGTGMGIDGNSIVRDSDELHAAANRLLSAYRQPVLVETYLPGREFTVGITGTGNRAAAVGVMEIEVDRNCDGGVYSYTSKQEYRKYARYKLIEGAVAEKCRCVALGAWRALGCRDGGRVDLRMNGDEEVQFLEVNPLAGLHPVDSDFPILAGMVGIGYRGLIERIMVSATDRMRRGG